MGVPPRDGPDGPGRPIEGIRLVSLPRADSQDLAASPGLAIEALAQEFRFVWDRYRSGDPNERRGGTIALGSGAYFQWIGYANRIAVECSSNAFLEPAHLLSPAEEDRLVGWGFSRPTPELPNFWLDVIERSAAEDAAFAVVAAMTTVFGLYAG